MVFCFFRIIWLCIGILLILEYSHTHLPTANCYVATIGPPTGKIKILNLKIQIHNINYIRTENIQKTDAPIHALYFTSLNLSRFFIFCIFYNNFFVVGY